MAKEVVEIDFVLRYVQTYLDFGKKHMFLILYLTMLPNKTVLKWLN